MFTYSCQNLSAAADDAKPVTHLLAIDLSSKVGTKLLHEAIRYLVDAVDIFSYLFSVLFMMFLLILPSFLPYRWTGLIELVLVCYFMSAVVVHRPFYF